MSGGLPGGGDAVAYGRSVSDGALEAGGSAVALRAIRAGYGAEPVLDGLALDVRGGSLTAILGASGSGKTTLLRVIAGFLRPDAGVVTISGRTVSGPDAWVPAERRRVGIVPQEGALFPHLDVLGNVMFGLPRGERARAQEVLEWVGMAERAQARPQELSGGQQQRVALARALAPRPDVILLDEPFSALDAGLRGAVRAQVKDVLAAAGTTAILVTHDQDEALSMADQVAVMAGGTVVQVGSPTSIYDRPVSLEVARFVGDVVECPGTVDASGHMRCILGSWPTDGARTGPGLVLIRPEQVRLAAHTGSGQAVSGRVIATEYHGHDTVVHVVVDDTQPVTVRVGGPSRFAVGDVVAVEVAGTPRWFPAD